MLLPLFFQAASMVVFWNLYDWIRETRNWFVHSIRIVNTVDELRASVNEVYYSSVLAVFVDENEVRRRESDSLLAAQESLKQLLGDVTDNPPQQERLRSLGTTLQKFIRITDQLDEVLATPATEETPVAPRGQVMRRLFEESLQVKVELDRQVEEFRGIEIRLQSDRNDDVNQSIRRTGTVAIVGLALVSCLTLFLFTLFREAISGRLSVISRNLKQLEMGEKLSPEVGGSDEIAQVDTALHVLAHALSAKAVETESFLYSVSHDLRSPLVNLSGFTDELRLSTEDLRKLIEANRAKAPELQKAIDIIDQDFERWFGFLRSAVSRLSKIIDALLKLSRAGRVEYANQPVDLNGVISRVVKTLDNSLTQKGARIKTATLPSVFGDETAYEQIFANLLANAIAYLDSARPGVIEVGCIAEPGAGMFETVYVKDNGVGMSPQASKRLFLAFQRFSPDLAPGEGVGLALVRRVLNSMGGRIWCETEQSIGTTFYLSLPRSAVQKVLHPEADLTR